MDKVLLDWFETLPQWKKADIVNDVRFDTFRERLMQHYHMEQ